MLFESIIGLTITLSVIIVVLVVVVRVLVHAVEFIVCKLDALSTGWLLLLFKTETGRQWWADHVIVLFFLILLFIGLFLRLRLRLWSFTGRRFFFFFRILF